MNVGLIGCGGISSSHIEVYKNIKNVKVVAVCDLNLDKARILAKRYNIDRVYQDYWDMFEKENLDLVDVCTPVSTHARIVCDAAKTVRAILVEKPMALNVSECEQMIKETKKHGTKLCVGHNQIFSPHIQKAKALIDFGEFDLLSFKATQKESFELLRAYNLAPAWNISPSQGGIIWEVCCHLAYLHLFFLSDIQEIYAVGCKVKYPVYDDFAVLLRTGDQRFGIIELSWVTKETEIVYELRDTTGKRIEIYRDFDYFIEKVKDPPINVSKTLQSFFTDENRVLQKWVRFGLSYICKRKLLPTYYLINSYIKSIKKDLQPPVSPEDGKSTVKLLECIKKSLDTHQPIKV